MTLAHLVGPGEGIDLGGHVVVRRGAAAPGVRVHSRAHAIAVGEVPAGLLCERGAEWDGQSVLQAVRSCWARGVCMQLGLSRPPVHLAPAGASTTRPAAR